MNTLMTIGIVAGGVVVVLLGILVSVKAFYKVPDADEALVKTGGKHPVVSTGGGLWVVPMLHAVARVSLQAIRVPIDRTATDAVPSLDMIPAEIKGEMFVQINPQDDKAIVLAVQSLGTAAPSEMADIVRRKIDSQVTDALRTAAFQKTFLQLNSEKKEFADAVVNLMQDDLSKLGLTLTAVSVTHVSQGPFTEDRGDVIAAEGRRNVAKTVEKNRQETNLITRQAEIAVQKQDVEAREQALTLELHRKEKEADQHRRVAEYEATQKAETAKAVLLQMQSEEEARVAQERAIATATAKESEVAEKARIQQTEQVAIRSSEATAAQKAAVETAAIKIAQAAAERKVAEEDADRQKEEALIARQKAVETAGIEKARSVEAALIEKEQAIKVADQKRQQAVEEAEVVRQQAIALRRAEEAAARATQAQAESKQKAAEEHVLTVRATAEAARQKDIVTIKAQEVAETAQIAADQAAYVATKEAEGERDAALKRAEAVKARAEGAAEAVKAEADGYAADLGTRASAEFAAAEKQAEARTRLAAAALKEGEASAEAHRLMIEAQNRYGTPLLARDVAIALIEQAPAMIEQLMAPVAAVTHDVKVLQINGLGGEGAVGEDSTAKTILGTGMALTGALPLIRESVQALLGNEDVKAVAGELTGVAKDALRQAASGVMQGAKDPGTSIEPSSPG